MFDSNILHHFAQINQVCQIIAAYLLLKQWIRWLRKEKLGLTQEQFAEKVGVEPRTVQRWESGGRKPRREFMMAIQELDESDSSIQDNYPDPAVSYRYVPPACPRWTMD